MAAARPPTLPPLQRLAGTAGFAEFAQLWTGWKFGKGVPAAACAHEVLRLSAASVLGVVTTSDPAHCTTCPEAVAFLQATRAPAFAATAAHVGAVANGPILLYRGVRHHDADSLRGALVGGAAATIPAAKLTSYSFSEGAARGFARKRIKSVARGAQSVGLVYRFEVAMDDFVFVESAELCDQLLIEKEVLVLHRAAVQIRQSDVVDDSVAVAAF